MSRTLVRLAAGALAALAVAASPPARATVIVDRSVPEQAEHASLVVRGKVTAQKVQWDEEHRLIVTRTFVSPSVALKGAAPKVVVVRQVGGTLDGKHLNVSGVARFRIGEDVVLFLENHPKAKGDFVLEAMGASKFTVLPSSQGPMVERSLSGLSLARREADGLIRPDGRNPTPNAMPYSELVKEVRDTAPVAPAGQLPTPNFLPLPKAP